MSKSKAPYLDLAYVVLHSRISSLINKTLIVGIVYFAGEEHGTNPNGGNLAIRNRKCTTRTSTSCIYYLLSVVMIIFVSDISGMQRVPSSSSQKIWHDMYLLTGESLY